MTYLGFFDLSAKGYNPNRSNKKRDMPTTEESESEDEQEEETSTKSDKDNNNKSCEVDKMAHDLKTTSLEK